MKSKLKLCLIILIGILFIAVGLLITFYPEISNYFNTKNQSYAIQNYETYVAEIPVEEHIEEKNRADAYNEMLFEINNIRQAKVKYLNKENLFESYFSILNPNNDGIMAIVDIPKINVVLPVYHDTDGPEVSVAVGHIPYTSLPTGKVNTHMAICGHTELATAKLFTDLDLLEIGDSFFLRVLQDKYEYCVDDIRIVEPDDYDCLNIVEGKEYVTLITCTPAGVGSHRLLVRGERVK